MSGDVRMRGFHERADLDAVRAWLDARPPLGRTETVSLDDALGRALAQVLVSEHDVPSFRRAAMDGWAVRGADTYGASPREGLTLRVVGAAYPGAPHDGELHAGEAVRIMTGAPVPEGADAVLRAEDGLEEDGRVNVHEPVAPKKHVAPVGEDIRAGTEVLPAGRRLRPQDLGVAASIGYGSLRVGARPTVVLLATGNELLAPGMAPHGAKIVDTNTPMLRALLRRDGAVLRDAQRVPDDAGALEAALAAQRPDVWLVTGGSSVGEEDHAPMVLRQRGTLDFHGVAIRPAAPTGVGTLGDATVFLLPGNPVSCLSAYDLLAGPLLRRLGGRDPALPYRRVRGALTHKIASVLGRVDYVRVAFPSDGAITPLMSRGASILSSTTRADGFLLVPRDLEGWPEGTAVEAFAYA